MLFIITLPIIISETSICMTARPTRVLSAHTTCGQRPLSGHTHTFSRKELIENVYTAQPHASTTRAASAKLLGQIAATGIEKSKKIIVKQSKKRQEMEEEILRLKRTVNGLTQQLCRQKGRTESIRKKGQKLSKILTCQYENQAYWNSTQLSSHLVTGIKHAYDELNNKYHNLKEQHELLLKQNNVTREIQQLSYIDALQHQNKALRQRLDSIFSQEGQGGTEASQVANFVIAELKEDRNRIAEKYKQLQGRYHMCQETLKDRNRKVSFLQKLIIQKDNNIHSVQRQNKRLRERAQGNGNLIESQAMAQSEWMERSSQRK